MKKKKKQRLRRNSVGFTLVELCLVVLLFAIVTALTSAQLSFIHRMIVRAELEQLYATCCVMQRRALLEGLPQKLQFDLVSNSYRYQKTVHKLPTSVRFGAAPGVKGPPSGPENVITSPVTFKDNQIIFYPDGVIQSGAVYMTDMRRRCTYALSCAVSKVSYLRKYQYTTQWRLL